MLQSRNTSITRLKNVPSNFCGFCCRNLLKVCIIHTLVNVEELFVILFHGFTISSPLSLGWVFPQLCVIGEYNITDFLKAKDSLHLYAPLFVAVQVLAIEHGQMTKKISVRHRGIVCLSLILWL